MIGAIFLVALIVTSILVGLNRMVEGLMIQCQSCERYRFRRSHCSKCGVVGNPTPEPLTLKKNPRKNDVRFH